MQTLKALEIMAPAGGHPQLLAAVRAGADAVYLGAGGFNARQGADNFAGDNLREAVAYCHGRGVRVYVTLNTIFADSETDAMVREIETIAASGCDAVIVQDLGVIRLLRQCCPSLPLHGSTQMSVHNTDGVQQLEELGLSRVVLARELSGEEIARIREHTSMELETFVHGALCMSVSGQCYVSSMLGGRSGNRGRCAQPCRLDFTAGQRHNVLSLRDLSLVNRIGELAACGVCAIKIEGRLKRPEYVTAAVTACREAQEGNTPDMATLEAVFSRSGFTDGYFTGKRTLEMFGIRRKEDVEAAKSILAPLEAAVRNETPLVPVDMRLTIAPDTPLHLAVTDGKHHVDIHGEPPQVAQNRPTDQELARRSLEKTGGTPFFVNNITFNISPGLMVPVSAMNALRSEALSKLLTLREATPLHRFTPPADTVRDTAAPTDRSPQLRIRLEHEDQWQPELNHLAAQITLPVSALCRRPELLLGESVIAAQLPQLFFPGEEPRLEQQLKDLKAKGLTTVLTGNLGGVHLARRLGFTVQGDYGLNLLNSAAMAQAADLGLADATFTFEGNLKDAAALTSVIPLGVIGYGHLPLMLLRNCPARKTESCGDCRGSSAITDRRGDDFPVICWERRYSQLLNPIPLWLGDKQHSLTGLSFVTLRFTTETGEQCLDITRRFLAGEPYYEGQKRTGGLYFRELL